MKMKLLVKYRQSNGKVTKNPITVQAQEVFGNE